MKENVHFFMHVQGLSVDPFGFSAPPLSLSTFWQSSPPLSLSALWQSSPPLSLLALWQEPKIWKGLYSDPSPISKQLF